MAKSCFVPLMWLSFYPFRSTLSDSKHKCHPPYSTSSHSFSCSLSFLTPCPLFLHDGVSLLSASHTSFSVSGLCPELPPSCHLAADICHIFPTQAPTFSWKLSQKDVNFHSDFSQDLIMYTDFSTWLNRYFSIDSCLYYLS